MVANMNQHVAELINEEGTLPAYAWPGGYPLFYLDGENNILCPKCANDNDNYTSLLVAYDVNYEDTHLHCDNCSERIESAYCED